MTSALHSRACRQEASFAASRCQPGPRLVAARPPPKQPLPRLTLHVVRVKINTEYNADPEAYVEENFKLEDVEELATGVVGDIMTSKNLRSTHPDASLRSADSKLDKITGLPVLDENNVVVGVISKKDMNRLRKQGVSFEEPVSKYMSTPPLVVHKEDSLTMAASIMLSKHIHRLCVVDDEGKLLGMLSRTDVFDPLMRAPRAESYDALTGMGAGGSTELQDYIQKSIDLDVAEQTANTEDKWVIKYLYDGDCSMCQALKAMLQRQDDGRGLINFVNIASMMYNPRENEGIEYEEAMETIHAIKRDGTILTGTDALKELYSTVGLGWAAALGNLPILSELADVLYNIISKYRLPMGKQLDAMMAMRRMKMTSEGVEHCVDDEEECHAEW